MRHLRHDPSAVIVHEAAAPGQAAEDFRRKQDQQPLLFLAGDHHMHTQFSSDGLYRVRDHAEHAAQY